MAAECPRGLQGVEWLTAQGARGAYVKSASGLINPELTSALVHWAANTVVPLPEDPAAEPWQNAISEYRRQSLKALDFDPSHGSECCPETLCGSDTNKRIILGRSVHGVAWEKQTRLNRWLFICVVAYWQKVRHAPCSIGQSIANVERATL